jgi:hypothetical protein
MADGADTRLSVSEKRAARNQSLFREVNERMREVARHDDWYPVEQEAFCECADESCMRRIMVGPAQYERIREHSAWFVVAPNNGHVVPEAERVIERHESYWVVEKVREAAAVADELDPRD